VKRLAALLVVLTATPAALATDGVVTKFEPGKVTIKAGGKTTVYYLNMTPVVYDEELIASPRFKVDEKVKVLTKNKTVYIEKLVSPREQMEDRVPAEVKDVLILDSLAKEGQFDLLSPDEQEALVQVAHLIKSGSYDKNALKNLRIRSLRGLLLNNFNLFNKEAVTKWLVTLADNSEVDELIQAVKLPPERQQDAKVHYAMMPRDEQEKARLVAKRIAKIGIPSLSDPEKDFLKQNRVLFGLGDGPLSRRGQ
jgi:hypothetical protein